MIRTIPLAVVTLAAAAACGSSNSSAQQAQADATVCANANIIDYQTANQALPIASPALRALVNKWEADLQAGSTADTVTDPDNPAMKLPPDAVDALNIGNWCSANGYQT